MIEIIKYYHFIFYKQYIIYSILNGERLWNLVFLQFQFIRLIKIIEKHAVNKVEPVNENKNIQVN